MNPSADFDSLISRKFSFFDRTGDCLDINLKPIIDWWNEDNESVFTLIRNLGKFLIFKTTSGFTKKVPVFLIKNISLNEEISEIDFTIVA